MFDVESIESESLRMKRFQSTLQPQQELALSSSSPQDEEDDDGKQARREGGAEGVSARGPGDTEGPWVQNCQDRMQNYGLRTPLVYLGGAIVLCTPPPFDSAF